MNKLYVLMISCALSLAACASNKPQADETPTADEPAVEEAPETETEPTTAPETQTSEVMPNDGTRQIGEATKCPVSGDVFTVAANSPKVEHDGGTYYLCCSGCIEKFEADPAKFLASAEQADDVPATAEGDEAPADAEGDEAPADAEGDEAPAEDADAPAEG